MRQWHNDTQVYIGAFQYLANKQHKYDHHRNLGNEKSRELKELMNLAKNLLCEIETAINNTGLRMPRVYTHKMMEEKLHFRTNAHDRNKYDEVDILDIKFAKVRFHEYLHNLDRIMKRPRKKRIPCKHNRKHKQRNLCRKRDADGKPVNCTLIEMPTETVNGEIVNRYPLRRLHHRRRNGNAGGQLDSESSVVRHNQIFDENGNRFLHPHRRHHQRGQRRHRNLLNHQVVDGEPVNGESIPIRRNLRKKMHRTLDLSSSSSSTTTITSTIIPPFSTQ